MSWMLIVLLYLVTLLKGQNYDELYLLRINKELERESPLLFTSERASTIADFEQTYSVRIVVRETFLEGRLEECLTQQKFFELDGFNPKTLTFSVADDGKFLNASIPRLLIQTVGLPFSSSLALQSPLGTQQQIYNNECGDQSVDVDTAFADNGVAFTRFYCSSIASGFLTYQPTQSFSVFTGEEVHGSWTATVFSNFASNAELRWEICYAVVEPFGRYSRDFSVANLNFPAYSQVNGVSRLTALYRNAQGEALYITINLVQ